MKAKDFRKQAWAALKNNWGTAVLSVLILSLIVGGLSAIPTVGSIATLILTGPLQLGIVIVMVNIIRGKGATVSNLFDGFKNFMTSFTLYLVNNIFVFLWSLLFVIPGIIKGYAYSMSYYILNDNPEMTQSEARKASIEMMKGHKWELFCLQFSFIGWYLLCILTFGILALWVSPYQSVATAAFYENLKGANAPANDVVIEEPVFEEATEETFTE